MATKTAARETGSARERLLAAANELFYDEGIHTVGIDRVIDRAGVAKATLYSAFGNKEGLIRAYLDSRHATTRARMEAGLARYDTPRDKLLGVFDIQGERFGQPSFRGCAFVSASAEGPRGGQVEAASDDYRRWVRDLFLDLARQIGVRDPDQLAHQLVLIYDGASVSARMDRDAATSTHARAAAAALLAAA
jgi:AcrR family transcriptional regulator